jgi:hypothetical protein
LILPESCKPTPNPDLENGMNISMPSATQRTMNRITLPLLLLACSVLGAWAVWKHIQCNHLEDRLAKMESEAASRAMRGLEPPKPGDRKVALKGKAGKQEVAGSDSGTDSGKTPGSQGTQDATGDMVAGIAKMMANPAMREMMRSQTRVAIGRVYQDLFDLLELKEPRRSSFEKLLHQKTYLALEAGLGLMDGPKTAEDRKAATAEVKAKFTEVDGQIKELLGKEDYGTLTRYEDSILERQQLKAFDTMLTSKDMRLDESTEGRLMDVMHKEREKFPFASRYMDLTNPDISRFTAENMARFSDEYARLNESIAKQAAGFLPSEQLELFRDSQEQQKNTINMQLGVAAKMFSEAGGK